MNFPNVSILISFFFGWVINLSFAQVTLYQDVFNGNVSVVGVASWGSTNINLNDYGSGAPTKALLISGNQIDNLIPNSNYKKKVTINGTDFFFQNETKFTERFESEYLQHSGSVHVIDVTEAITSNILSIFTETMTFPPGENSNQRFYTISLLLIYKDATKEKLAINVSLNNIQVTEQINWDFGNLIPVDTSYPAVLSISMGHMVYLPEEGSYIWVNSDSLGLVGGGNEYNVADGGTILGQFDYINNSIIPIGDDLPDDLMNANDALANIQNYLPQYSNQFLLSVNRYPDLWGNNLAKSSNPIWASFLAYSTPCDTFSVTSPNDTTICFGETLQLNVTGGQSYEWSPSTDLSCDNCPNPIFSGDTSRFYTVRVWNNDSCSVVRPVKINVRPKPTFGSISVNPSECGTNNGSVILNPASGTQTPITFTLNDTLSHSGGTFTNLTSGNYTFHITDGFGCTSEDSSILVTEVINTNASFTVSPTYGTVPLTVSIVNTSQNATDYLWSVNGVNQGNNLTSFTCDSSGTYTIELIAWKYDPSCADTSVQSIIAIDRLIIPTAFTPDNDGVNDFWEIPNIDEIYPDNIVRIYNRWGSLLFESEKGIYTKNPWYGYVKSEALPVGSYFFIIETNDQENNRFEGTVSILN